MVEKELVEKNTISELEVSGLLAHNDADILKNIDTELITSLQKSQMFRPKYLMEVSVLEDVRFPTPDSKYWQAILERNVMFQNLCFLYFDYKEKLADIKIKNVEMLDLEETNTELSIAQAEKLNIQKDRFEMQIEFIKKEARERVREIRDWTEIIKKLEPQMKYSKDNPEEHMPESYLIRFAEQTKLIKELGASDMNGAINTIAQGKTASKYWNKTRSSQA